jgi:hypothetical protein
MGWEWPPALAQGVQGKESGEGTMPKSAMVWIEDAAARIARGEADSVTRRGLHVRLSGPPAFGQGDEVAVRLSFERGAPTVATTARVALVRADAGQVECELEWDAPVNERKDLEAWLARAA